MCKQDLTKNCMLYIILHISTNATIIILRHAARVAKILQAFDNLNA